MQDSGLYALGAIKPDNLDVLLEIAFNSRYPTIRLRALEIARLMGRTAPIRGQVLAAAPLTMDERMAHRWLMGFCLAALGFYFLPPMPNVLPPLVVLLGMAMFVLAMKMPHEKLVRPVGISMFFLAAHTTGTAGLLPLCGWMAVWLGRNAREIHPARRRMMAFCWIFVSFAALLGWAVGGNDTRLLSALGMMPPKGPLPPVAEALFGQQQRFQGFFFFIAALVTMWLVRRNMSDSDQPEPLTEKNFYTWFGLACFLLVVLQLSFIFGLKAVFATQGLGSVLGLATLLAK